MYTTVMDLNLGHDTGQLPHRLLLLNASRGLADCVLASASRILHHPTSLLWVLDCANSFDPYLLVRCSRQAECDAHDWLGRVRTVRAFTPYQTVTLLEQSVQGQTGRQAQDLLLVLFACHGLADTGFATRERAFLSRRITSRLRALARQLPASCWIVTGQQLPACAQDALAALADLLPTSDCQAPRPAVQPSPPPEEPMLWAEQFYH